MTANYDRAKYVEFALAAMKRGMRDRTVRVPVSEWLFRSADDDFGIEFPHELRLKIGRGAHTGFGEAWKDASAVLKAHQGVLKGARRSALARNVEMLAEFFALDALECRILYLVILARVENGLGELLEALGSRLDAELSGALEVLLERPAEEIAGHLDAGSRLARSGLILRQNREPMSRGSGPRGGATRRLASLLAGSPGESVPELLRSLVGREVAPSLEWEDFAHLGVERDLAAGILAGALAQHETGVNILVYGPPGTGKTEFCKALARQVGAQLFLAGEADEDGGEPTRSERIGLLRLAQQVHSRRPGALVLFDEMEDLLGGGESRTSKVFGNAIMETAAVPTLWTCNAISGFDPALLRRMTFAMEVGKPPQAVRARVWRRQFAAAEAGLTDADAEALAREFDSPPAIVANAVRAARLAGGGAGEVRLAVRAVAKAMDGGRERPPEAMPVAAYDAALVNADVALAALPARLLRPGATRRISLCLFGPPGTGKSAYVRHLADRLGLEVMQKRASDLLGMYVGESERRIADAFAEARRANAFLIFDEADSLLADRAGAQRSWEVSQVNEMLTWMDSHPLPFACTTNLMERVDAAALRRFTIKARFGFLRPEQAELAFARFFGIAAPEAVRRLERLTPGDFAVVRRKAEVFGESGDADALAEMLAAECAAKPGHREPLGFVP